MSIAFGGKRPSKNEHGSKFRWAEGLVVARRHWKWKKERQITIIEQVSSFVANPCEKKDKVQCLSPDKESATWFRLTSSIILLKTHNQ